jgi:hypothetical protein
LSASVFFLWALLRDLPRQAERNAQQIQPAAD